METKRHLDALIEIEEILPHALALADLLQAVNKGNDLIDPNSLAWGADMIHSKLKEIEKIVLESITDDAKE